MAKKLSTANVHKAKVQAERIAAYPTILALFPTATDMARELALDNRATVSHWGKRGVPIEYILVLDAVGLIHKEELVPSVKNWDLMLSKYEQVVMNKLQKVLFNEEIKKTATTVLQSVIKPVMREEILSVLEELGFVSPEISDTDEDLDSIL